MSCLCGAPDCNSCGPDQGYEVVKVRRNGNIVFSLPEDVQDDDFFVDGDEFVYAGEFP